MVSRSVDIEAAIKATSRKTSKAAEKRDAKRKKDQPIRELRVVWVEALRGLYGDELKVPPWRGEDFGLAKKLIKDLGGVEQASKVVRHFVSTWEARMTSGQRARGDMPSVKVCWVLRQKLVAELDGLAKMPQSKRERLQTREYSEEAAAASPKQGW